MTDEIRPLETFYEGFRFRSRLEARWAVFFTEMQLEFEYEPEGFKLPGGGAYLPDFYLPSLGVFAEVKPKGRLSTADLLKMIEFAKASEKPLLLIVGPPTQHEMFLIDKSAMEWKFFLELSEPGETEEELVSGYLENLRDFSSVTLALSAVDNRWTLVFQPLPPPVDLGFSQALLKAKQARFEHGEKG